MSDIFGKISIDPDKPGSAPQKKLKQKKEKKKIRTSSHKKKKTPGKLPIKAMLWLILPTGLLALYSLIGFFGVPYYISHFVPQQLSRNSDLKLEFKNITFNPFTFTLNLHTSEVTEPDGKPVITVPRLELHLAPIDVLRLDFVCRRLDVSSPSLHLVRHEDGSYNFGSLLPQLSPQNDGSKMMGFSDLPFFFSLNNITITDGTVVFDDKPTSKTHRIDQLQLQLPTLSNIPFQADSYINPHFSAIINGSPVTLKGSTRKQPKTDSSMVTQLSWELKDVALQQYVNYLPFDLPFSLKNGVAAGVLDLKFNNHDDRDDKLAIHFDLTVADIDVETQQQKLQLTSPAMKMSGSFIPVKKIFSVTALHLDSPEILVNSQDVLQEIGSIFLVNSKKATEAIPVKKPVVFALYSLQFTEGSLKQQHPGTKDKEAQQWAGLTLTLHNYVSHGSYDLADNKPSLLKISGHKKNDTDVFSFFGGFKSPSEINGELKIKNMAAENLFSWILPAEKSITAQGSAEMKALLGISKKSGELQLKSSLSKVIANITKAEISAQSGPLLSADELSFKNVEPRNKTIVLGDITAKNAKLFLTRDKTPGLFRRIGSEQYTISRLNYQGDISIDPGGRNSSSFVIKDAAITYDAGDTGKKEAKNLVLSGGTGKDGKLDATGSVSFNPFTVDVSTTFEQLNSVETASLLGQDSFLSKTAGKLSGKGRLVLPQASFTGDLKVSKGHFIRTTEPTFSWDTFALEDITYSTKPFNARAARIHFNRPQLEFSIQKENNTIPEYCLVLARDMLKNLADQPSGQKKSPVHREIQEISFTEGRISISDQRLSPVWKGKIEAVNGTISDVAPAGSDGKTSFAFTGKLDGADLSWTGSIDRREDTKADDYTFKLKNYPLKTFGAQLEAVSDINIETASISLSLSSEWKAGEQYQALQATLSQLEPGAPDATSALPLALLSDSRGELKMNLSTLETPALGDTSLFNTLTGNFQKLTIKAGLSPLLLAKGDFSDLIDNEFIDFNPGQFMLSNKGRETLTRYGALLVAHPNIKLSLSGGLYLEPDKKSLYAQLKKDESVRIEKINKELFGRWQKNKEEYETQVSDAQNSTLPKGEISESNIPTKVLAGFRPLLPEPVVVHNEMLFDLAEKRLDIVKKLFMTQFSLAEGRVEIKQQSINELVKKSGTKGVHIRILPHK